MRIGIVHGAGESLTVDQAVEKIVSAESDGFASCWVPNIFSHDALTLLALAGQKTTRIELGTAVVPTYPRHPHALAQQAATVNAAIGGRLALGVGRSHKIVIEDLFGLAYDKPLTHMREYLTIVRDLTRTGACSVNGKAYRVNASLDTPGGSEFPLMIGALMPKMLELCGELCDGTLTWMSGPRYTADTVVPTLESSAKAAGRAMPRVVCSLPVCVTDDKDGAKNFAAEAFAVYGTLPVYRACLDAEGVDGPADISLIGSEKEVAEGLARVRDAGATDFYAAIFPDPSGPQSVERSLDFLRSLSGEL